MFNKYGESIFEDKPHNSHYSKEFKEQDITNKKVIEVNISEAEKTQANSKIKSQFPSKLQSKFKTNSQNIITQIVLRYIKK